MALSGAEIAASAQRLLAEDYGLLLVSNRAVLDRLEVSPFGVPVTPVDFLAAEREAPGAGREAPGRGEAPGAGRGAPGAEREAPGAGQEAPGAGQEPWRVADLMRVYNVLNQTAFGEKGIPLQNWVMIDLGLLPSAFLLITLSLERAAAALAAGDHPRTRSVLGAVLAEADRLGHRGPIPVAGYCAAPTPVPGSWVGWSLCSAIPGLGTTAKGLALEAYRAETLTGVAQFCDPSLRVHRKFGPMQVLAAVLDLHPVAHTLIYRTELHADDPEQSPTLTLDCHDGDAQRELQRRIDSGAGRFYILSPGLVGDQVPILELS